MVKVHCSSFHWVLRWCLMYKFTCMDTNTQYKVKKWGSRCTDLFQCHVNILLSVTAHQYKGTLHKFIHYITTSIRCESNLISTIWFMHFLKATFIIATEVDQWILKQRPQHMCKWWWTILTRDYVHLIL